MSITPSPFQSQVMAVPEAYDLFLGGGRGGGKSFVLALLALRHAEQHKANARVLYLRRTYRSLQDFALVCRDVFGQVYGQKATFNASDGIWRFPGGGYLELSQLEGPQDYSKYQGRSFSLLLVDEAGEYATPADLDRLRSNLRGPKGVPVRMVLAANPGGVGHAWLAKRYVNRATPWVPFAEPISGREWVYAPSRFSDNPALDQAQYERQLRASCPTDAELLKAWLTGDWAIARGAFFGPVIDADRNALPPWSSLPGNPQAGLLRDASGWRFYLAHDYGSSAPSATYVCAVSPGDEWEGRYFPRDSIILVDELATVDPDDPNRGMGYTVPRLADEIKQLAAKWGIRPDGYADDAIFSNHGSGAGSIAEEFRREGVHFLPARKGQRVPGWEVMRRLLAGAGQPDVAGLYVSRLCGYWWDTVPYLGRDPRRIEDVDTRGPDHAADACRMGCTAPSPPALTIDMRVAI